MTIATALGCRDDRWASVPTDPDRTAFLGSAYQPPDADDDGIPDDVEPREGRDRFFKDNDVFTSPRLFAMQQYRDILAREGDAGGITHWTGILQRGQLSRAGMIESFLSTPEFQARFAPVTRLYLGAFGRTPDYDGLLHWHRQLLSGASLASIAQGFVDSPEFEALYGTGLSDSVFVTRLYERVLGRSPDSQGLATWRNQLQTRTRGEVLLAFTESAEHKALRAVTVFIVDAFAALLERSPSSGELAAWRASLQGGAPRSTLLNAILGTDEYHDRFLPPRGTSTGDPALALVQDGLAFPTYLTAPAGDARLFIIEKAGRILIFKNGALVSQPFLDLTGQVSTVNEQGLFALAFHPNYASNGRFFVSFTNPAGDTRVVEYARSSGNEDRASSTPVRTILAVDQPFANHNGGQIAFGPDGTLYVARGDGGGGGDPQDNAENLGTLLGKILRLDVDAGAPYVVPADNPFVGVGGARGEIWDYGLRNPWRFSFDRDRAAGDLYIADVGQSAIEEVNVVRGGTRGHNYGWDVFEGSQCFEPPAGGCNPSGVTFPVFEYANDAATCSVTGGYVYRGSALPHLRGLYFFSDFCAGWVRSFRWNGGTGITELRFWNDLAPGGSVPSLGEDAFGELYILTTSAVYKIVPS